MPAIANYTSTVLLMPLALKERLQATVTGTTTKLELSNFLPTTTTTTTPENDVEDVVATSITDSLGSTQDTGLSYAVNHEEDDVIAFSAVANGILPTLSGPRIASLVASSAEDLSGGFRDVTFDIFDDEHDLYGSPLAFDASEHGLWNGRFVPPPPRPPFFVDEPVLSDGLTTCDLCSWAMPTKSTFIFEGTIEKATELGWPLTLIIVSVLSALFGAIIMIAVVRCRRKKSSNHRNDTHVQWWSRNKRPNVSSMNGSGGASGGVGGSDAHNNSNNNNNHFRRSNIYTAHPADSIRGLQPLPLPLPQQQQQQQQQYQPTLSASSSLTAMTTAMVTATAPPEPSTQHYLSYQQQQQQHRPHHHHQHSNQQQQQLPHDAYDAYVDDVDEHEYHQPQELQLQLQMPLQQRQQNQQHHHLHHHHHHQHQHQQQQLQQHQRQHSSSMSSVVTSPSPSLLHANMLPQQPQFAASSLELQQQQDATTAVAATRHWPQATTMVVAS